MPGFGVILANEPGADVADDGGDFILIPKQPPDPAAAAEALKFFTWAYTKGDKMAEELDYVPMPAKVVRAVEKVWASEIKDSSGKAIYTEAHGTPSFDAAARPARVVAGAPFLELTGLPHGSCAAAGECFD